MQRVERIKKLLSSLPKGDQPIGERFLETRDFESLKELIDSAIYKIRKNLKTENPKAEYLEIDLEKIDDLNSEVTIYMTMLELPDSNLNHIKLDDTLIL